MYITKASIDQSINKIVSNNLTYIKILYTNNSTYRFSTYCKWHTINQYITISKQTLSKILNRHIQTYYIHTKNKNIDFVLLSNFKTHLFKDLIIDMYSLKTSPTFCFRTVKILCHTVYNEKWNVRKLRHVKERYRESFETDSGDLSQ